MHTMKRIEICGVIFNNFTLKELETILTVAAEKRDGKTLIVTPNVDFIIRANNDSNFREIINNADISLCDSSIVLAGSYLLKRRLKARLTGYDAMFLLLKLAAVKKENIFLLGSTKDTLKLLKNNLMKTFSGLQIAGLNDGYFDFESSQKIIDAINASGARYLFVGMGSPRQEFWVTKYIDKINVDIIICVGGLFNIFANKVKRAPKILQYVGLEWFWRLLNEPKRLWKRYMVEDLYFFRLVLKEMIRGD